MSCPDQDKWVEYIPGTLDLIFTVPHNGADKASSIPDRVAGCQDSNGNCRFPGSDNCPQDKVCSVSLKADSYTRTIAELARERFGQLGDGLPHLIISKLHRSKMDPNREEEDAAQGNEEAIQAYRAFHCTVQQVKAGISGPGLLLDFHGQTHGLNSTELGYAISRTNLNAGSLVPSSISSLTERLSSLHSVEDLIWGQSGLGALLESAGYMAVPSPRKPKPGSDKYWSGGFITQQYGSREGGQVDAIQLEMPSELRIKGGEKVRTEFAETLGEVLWQFYHQYY